MILYYTIRILYYTISECILLKLIIFVVVFFIEGHR